MEIIGIILGVAGLGWGIYAWLKPKSPKKIKPEDQASQFIVPHLRNSMLRHEDEWIEMIREKLATEENAVISQSIAIQGQGGIGKTAMAIEYAYRYAEEYPGGVFWLQMEQGIGQASLGFLQLAEKMGLKFENWQELSEQNQINIVSQFINKSPFKLIILDNFDDNILPTELVTSNCHIMVTTRQKCLALSPVEMMLPKENEAIDIFSTYAGLDTAALSPKDKKAIEEITRIVDRLPLALEILGQLARTHSISSIAKKIAKEIVSIVAPTTTKDITSIVATLNLAGHEFKHSKTKEGLITSAYLSPENIEIEVIADFIDIDKKIAEEIMSELASLCIVQKGKKFETYGIHRLTQEAAREMDSNYKIGLKSAEKISAIIKKSVDKGTYQKAYYIVPHLIQIASLADDELLESDFPSCPFISHWAGFLNMGGYYSQSEILEKNCIKRIKREKGKEHPDYVAHLNNLALVLNSQGKYEKAEELVRQALEIDEKTIGKEHPDYVAHLNNLALVLDSQGKYEKAEELVRQALEIGKKTIGMKHPDYAIRLNNLASVLESQGKYVEAEKFYRQALEIGKKTIGMKHPDYAIRLNNLALVLESQGKYEEAEDLVRQALEIGKKTIGKKHPDYAMGLSNLASVLQSQGKYVEAEKFYKQALEIGKKTIGTEHPDYATRLNNLSNLLIYLGKHDEAEKLVSQSLEIDEKTIGMKHPDYATQLNNLALELESQGKYEKAEKILRQALEIGKKTIGTEHPVYSTYIGNLASVLQAQGKHDEAEKLVRQSLEIDEKTIGTEHPDYAIGLSNLAGLLQEQGKHDEAEKLVRQSLEIEEKTIGKKHPDYAIGLSNLAGLLQEQGKHDEAEKLVRQALEILQKSLGNDHPSTILISEQVKFLKNER